MRNINISMYLVILFSLLLAISCQEEKEDEAGDAPYRPWGEDLSPCDPYVADFAWFEIEDFGDKVEEFAKMYEDQPQPCDASVSGKDLEIVCDGWTVSMRWLKETGGFPIMDGHELNVAAHHSLTDFESIDDAIWILNDELDTLLFQAIVDGGLTWEIESLDIKLNYNIECEYYSEQDQPPTTDEYPWSQVVGLSVNGHLNDIIFDVPEPAQAVITEEGNHWAILPIGYTGTNDFLKDAVDAGGSGDNLFQLIKN